MNVSYRGQHSTLVIENPDPKEDVDQFGVPPVDDNMEMEERPAPDVFPAYQDETDEYNATTENVDTSFRADIPTVVIIPSPYFIVIQPLACRFSIVQTLAGLMEWTIIHLMA